MCLPIQSYSGKAVVKRPKLDKRETRREAKALTAARLEKSLEKELVSRLKSRAYGDAPLNVNENVWRAVLEAQEEAGEAEVDLDEEEEDYDEEEEEEREFVEDLEDESDLDDLEDVDDLADLLGSASDDDDDDDDGDEEAEGSDSEGEDQQQQPKKRKAGRAGGAQQRKKPSASYPQCFKSGKVVLCSLFLQEAAGSMSRSNTRWKALQGVPSPTVQGIGDDRDDERVQCTMFFMTLQDFLLLHFFAQIETSSARFQLL